MGTFVKVVLALVAIWIAFMVIGFVLKAVVTLAIIGAVITVGVVGYNAIKGSSRKQIR
ncbi:hypothetical protein [Labedaea rhizosphaerae]|uniref:hypothetical protein n=1 Tax=Labedaea rhizosphaerae TaxID=598644 RepID=UPI001FB6E4CC|nr:hypothetical protein [Labedaea rhizosphaerae]